MLATTRGPALSTILVVDDDPDTRSLLRLVFEVGGHLVVEAAHGAEALDLIGLDLALSSPRAPARMSQMEKETLINKAVSRPMPGPASKKRDWKALRPDVVVTDLMMPVLSGQELIGRLRSAPATAAIPIVVISASSEAAEALETAGLVTSIFKKPFDPIALSQLVDSLISWPATATAQ